MANNPVDSEEFARFVFLKQNRDINRDIFLNDDLNSNLLMLKRNNESKAASEQACPLLLGCH